MSWDLVTGSDRKPNIKHHSQADDLWARFKVPEWGVFCHTERLRNRPAWLKLVLSDSTRQGQAAQMPERPAVQAGWNRQKRMPKTGMSPKRGSAFQNRASKQGGHEIFLFKG